MLKSGVAEAFVAETGAAQLAEMCEIAEIGALRRRMVLSAAVAEDICWRAYEHQPYELRADDEMPPAFSSLDVNEAGAAVSGMASAVQGALREVMVPPDGAGSLSVSEAVARRCEASERVASALAEAVVMSPLDESEEEKSSEEAEDAATLQALEIQVWLELDAMLRAIARLSGEEDAMPAPIQLLGLMPPPPQAGWPDNFGLQRVVAELEKAEATRKAYSSAFELEFESDPEPYQPVDSLYPPRRRAQRLSFSVWPVLAQYWGGLEMQPALEVESTGDRLRIVLLRLRALMSQLEDKGYGDLV